MENANGTQVLIFILCLVSEYTLLWQCPLYHGSGQKHFVYREDNEKHCQDDYSLGIEMMGKALQAESRICKGTETQKLLACAGNGEQL